MKKLFILSFLSFLISGFHAQHLIINEVSQGTGTSEYVEFVVIGTPTCASPAPGYDLRKVIIDDNNGNFATGSSTGIAPGAVRFANNSFWQNVPQGTLIVIYNETSINTSLPPDDISLNDGNCRLIIPANSTLLEKTTTSPTLTNQNYPPDINWTAGGSWSPLAMANSDDSFQVQNYPVSAAPFHAVSWGNNSNNSIIYFAGTAAAKVFSFTNNSSNDWNLSSNWSSAAVATNQTPGAPNNTANAAWIGSMNPSCSNLPSLTITETLTNESCSNACNGTISITTSNGVAPYTYSWSTGATSSALANLCPGTYTLTVTGANGCSESETYTIVTGAAMPNAAISAAGPFTNQDPAQQLQALNPGGVWNANCGACLSASGSFNPQIAGVGSWQVCYTLGSGICTDTQCIVLVVTNGCTPQTTSETLTICPGDSILINGNWQSTPGTYAQSFLDVNLCDSTHIAYLNVYNTLNISETIPLCEFDSVWVFNQWIYNTQNVVQTETDANGCSILHTIQVQETSCVTEPTVIYIPNVFTPNGDDVNDTFEIVFQNGLIERGWILNRWGNVIADFSPTQFKWDGTDQRTGLPVLDGVYTYVVYFKPANTVNEIYQGFVVVVR
jgi:gliding motility-associated-like protein